MSICMCVYIYTLIPKYADYMTILCISLKSEFLK